MAPEERDGAIIHISVGTIIRALLVVVGAVVLWYLRDIILVLLTAIVLASAIEPGIRWLTRRAGDRSSVMIGRGFVTRLFAHRFPRLVSVVFVYLMGGVGLAIVSYFFLPAIVDDVKRIATIIPQILEEGGIGSPTPLEGSAPIEGELGRILDLLRDGPSGQGGALHTASLFFGGFLSFILILVLSFYFSAQERGLEGFIRLVAPIRSRGYIIDLWRRAQAKIGLWFQGQIVLSVLITVVAYLGLTIMGIESALLLAVIMGVFELIPVFGPIMASVPGIVIGYTEGIRYVEPGLTAALFVALFYTIIQQFESHLFYPLVMRKIIGLPPVLVIIALVVGAKMAGFLGVILSVPLTAVAMEYFGDVAREKRIYDDD